MSGYSFGEEQDENSQFIMYWIRSTDIVISSQAQCIDCTS